MNLRLFALLILFLSSASASLAQERIRITVFDGDDKQPVPFAYVHVYSSESQIMQTTVQTNEMGVATVSPESYPAGIEIVSMGYESYKQQFNSAPVAMNITVYLDRTVGSMNEVVITGNAEPTKLKNALSAYQVITKAQIRAMGAVTLDEALKYQINTQINTDNVLGTSVEVQGQAGNKVKVMIDGVPLNGREAGNINLSQINMNNVERIEVVQGPMSVMYGTDALGGVINVITRKNSKSLALNLNTFYESVGRYNANLSATVKIADRHQLTFGGGKNHFTGWGEIEDVLQYQQHSLPIKREYLFKPNEQYLGNLAYAYRAGSGFQLNAASDFVDEHVVNKQNPKDWLPFGSKAEDEHYRTRRSMNRLGMSGSLGKNGHWQSQNGFNHYHRTRTTLDVDMTTLTDSMNTVEGSQDTSTFNDFSSRSSYSNNFKKLKYTVGYDLNLSFAKSLKIPTANANINDYAVYTNISAPLFTDELTAQLGLRASYNTAYKAPLIPSFNLLYQPVEKVQLRGSYAKGFRAPSLKELYLVFIDNNHRITGSTTLEAETSDHMQASVSWQAVEKGSNYLQFIFTGYYNDVKNGIVLIPLYPDDPTSIDYYYGNLLRQRNTIATLQVDGQWQQFRFQLGYSRNYTLSEAGLYEAFNTGEATANLQYQFRKAGLSFNLMNKFNEARARLIPGIDGMPTFAGRQKAYHMLDVSAEKSLFKKKLQLVVGVKNLLDVRQINQAGATTGGVGGAHGTSVGNGGFLPRRMFASMNLTID